MLVKGIILSGIGMMIAFQDAFRLPKWSWWGFVVALFGIITIIPIRGMARNDRPPRTIPGSRPEVAEPTRWGLLVGGLAILLYGFLAAFMGRTPFVDFTPRSDLTWLTGILVGVSGLSLWLRELWKARLAEGSESIQQRILSNVWMYLSVLFYMYGAVVLFMGRYMYPHPGTNPWGVVLGSALFTAGASLVIGFRPFALRNELTGTITIMVGMLAALENEARWK